MTFNIKKTLGFFIIITFIVMIWLLPVAYIRSLPEALILNESEIQSLCTSKDLHSLVTAKYQPQSVYTSTNCDSLNYGTIDYKLFNLFPVKSVNVYEVFDDKIYACGKTVGISLQSKGVVITGMNPILTQDGKVMAGSNLQVGDVLCEIEGEPVNDAKAINVIINKAEYVGKELVVKAKRNSENYYTTIKPIKDIQTNEYKLGLWVRDEASGVGTVTYIRPDNLRFGALGHPISDLDTGTALDVFNGNLYKCNVLSISKGIKGKAGEIKGLFLQNGKTLGDVDENNQFGVFGQVDENSDLLNSCKLYKIGGKISAKPGKAQILCCLDGVNVEEFDIEIIKTNYQSTSNDKSMVIKITDKELIKQTGGIVQGMSGSPIIQNGKLIGAVTHVFVNDPTKGFGVYLDWMINN